MDNSRRALAFPVRAPRGGAAHVAVRTGLKGAVKKVREALEKGDAAGAKAALKAAEKAIDGAASKGVLHRNTASRRISRLAHAVAKAAPAK